MFRLHLFQIIWHVGLLLVLQRLLGLPSWIISLQYISMNEMSKETWVFPIIEPSRQIYSSDENFLGVTPFPAKLLKTSFRYNFSIWSSPFYLTRREGIHQLWFGECLISFYNHVQTWWDRFLSQRRQASLIQVFGVLHD